MNNEIIINGISIIVEKYDLTKENNDSGGELATLEIEFTTSKQKKEKVLGALKAYGNIISIPEKETAFRATRTKMSHRSIDTEEQVFFNVTFLEIDSIQKNPHINEVVAQITASTIQSAVGVTKRIKALEEVLIDKGVITKEELDEKYQIVDSRDHKQISEYLMQYFLQDLK
ncbi:hypothetical protein [Paenibacillus amylolyticus]|uniref:hypothetical protein n=1 Tax=Paenibacillus amylolyticus TaxID=1451 RepID=UPI000FDAAC10|nr:hypothetical protein [Paenibacillus amylolyticus]